MTSDREHVRCPSCRSEIREPRTDNVYTCKHCGRTFISGDTEKQIDPLKEELSAPVKSADVSQAQATMHTANETGAPAVMSQGSSSGSSPIQEPKRMMLPALPDWKTSVGFSILGLLLIVVWMCVVGMICLFLMSHAFPNLKYETVRPIVGMINGLTYSILCVIYGAIVYPSYFGENPLIRSRRIISCFNFLFGNVIFGPLWNRNLTQGDKRDSYIAFIASSALSAGLIALLLMFQLPHAVATNMQLATSSSSGTAAEQSTSLKDDRSASYTNKDAGFAVDFKSRPEVSSDDDGEIAQDKYYCPLSKNADGLTYWEMVLIDYVEVPIYEAEEEKGFLSGLADRMTEKLFGSTPDSSLLTYSNMDSSPTISCFFQDSKSYGGLSIIHSNDRIFYVSARTIKDNQMLNFLGSFKLI